MKMGAGIQQEADTMKAGSTGERIFARARDEAGTEYICRMDAIKDLSKVRTEDLKYCIDKEAVSPRFVI